MKNSINKSMPAIFLILLFASVLCFNFADLSLKTSFFGFPGLPEIILVIFFAMSPTFLLLWGASTNGYKEYSPGFLFAMVVFLAIILAIVVFVMSILPLGILYALSCAFFLIPTILYILKRNKRLLEIETAEKAIAIRKAKAKVAEHKRELEKIFQEFFDKNALYTESQEVYELTEYADKIMDLTVIEFPKKIKETLNDFNKIPVTLRPWLFAVVAKRLTELKNCSVEDLFQE